MAPRVPKKDLPSQSVEDAALQYLKAGMTASSASRRHVQAPVSARLKPPTPGQDAAMEYLKGRAMSPRASRSTRSEAVSPRSSKAGATDFLRGMRLPEDTQGLAGSAPSQSGGTSDTQDKTLSSQPALNSSASPAPEPSSKAPVPEYLRGIRLPDDMSGASSGASQHKGMVDAQDHALSSDPVPVKTSATTLSQQCLASKRAVTSGATRPPLAPTLASPAEISSQPAVGQVMSYKPLQPSRQQPVPTGALSPQASYRAALPGNRSPIAGCRATVPTSPAAGYRTGLTTSPNTNFRSLQTSSAAFTYRATPAISSWSWQAPAQQDVTVEAASAPQHVQSCIQIMQPFSHVASPMSSRSTMPVAGCAVQSLHTDSTEADKVVDELQRSNSVPRSASLQPPAISGASQRNAELGTACRAFSQMSSTPRQPMVMLGPKAYEVTPASVSAHQSLLQSQIAPASTTIPVTKLASSHPALALKSSLAAVAAAAVQDKATLGAVTPMGRRRL